MARYDIRPKNRITLVGVEIIILSLMIPYQLAKKWEWDTLTSIIAGVITAILLSALFFGMRIFRYVFSILFSLAWGFLAYMFADKASASNITPWVAAVLVVVIALSLHKDHFKFETGSL